MVDKMGSGTILIFGIEISIIEYFIVAGIVCSVLSVALIRTQTTNKWISFIHIVLISFFVSGLLFYISEISNDDFSEIKNNLFSILFVIATIIIYAISLYEQRDIIELKEKQNTYDDDTVKIRSDIVGKYVETMESIAETQNDITDKYKNEIIYLRNDVEDLKKEIEDLKKK